MSLNNESYFTFLFWFAVMQLTMHVFEMSFSKFKPEKDSNKYSKFCG